MAASALKIDDDRTLHELCDSMYYEAADWRTRMQRQDDLLRNKHHISYPPGLPFQPTNAFSGMARAQLRMLLGMLLSSDPTAGLVSPAKSQQAQEAIEELETAGNILFPLLEEQSQDVRAPTVSAQCKLGIGWQSLHGVSERLSKKAGMPLRDDVDEKTSQPKYDSPKSYQEARRGFIRSMGTRGGRSFLVYRHIPTEDMLFRLDDDGQLACVIEQRELYVMDLLSNPRYETMMPGLRGVVNDLTQKDRTRMLGSTVRFLTVETPEWCTTAVSKSLNDFSLDRPDASDQVLLNSRYDGMEVCDSYPNPIGRIRYVPTYGLTESARNQYDRVRGIYQDMADLIHEIDTILSHIGFDHQLFTFSPLALRAIGNDANRPPPPVGPDGKIIPFQFEPGIHKPTIVWPGWDFAWVTKPPYPELLNYLDRLERQAQKLGISDAVRSGIADSGYQQESILNTELAANKALVRGNQRAYKQLTSLMHDTLRFHGETMELMQRSEDDEARGGTWKKLDIDVLRNDDLHITIEVQYEIKRPMDETAALQNYRLATDPSNPILSKKTALRKYLHVENYHGERRAIRVEQVEESEPWKTMLQQEAMKQAGQLDLEQEAAAQAAVDLATYRKLSPALARLLAEEAPLGAPGSGPAQEYLASQNGQATPPNGAGGPSGLIPQGAPPPAPPGASLALPGGTPTGQRQGMPGGARRVGGVG